jgi:cobalamin biosynthesis Mg chelatase CobN
VQITISNRALKAHARHQDGRDIIPAPAGGCPGAAAPAEETAAAVGTAIKSATPGTPEASTKATERTETARKKGESHVAGVIQTNRTATAGRDAAGAPAPVAAAERSDEHTLPFTGMDVLLVVLIAGGLLLTGFALRRASNARRTTA